MAKAPKKTSADIYASVTASIIESIEAGCIPWRRPWDVHGPAGMPRNGHGRLYSGINVVLLWAQAHKMGYRDPRWLTFKQAKAKGGHVRRGEKACSVVLWRQVSRTVEDENGEDQTQTFPVIKTFSVFNAEQVEGLKPAAEAAIDAGEVGRIVAATGADIRHGGGRAFYSRDGDYIRLPERWEFQDEGSYSATLLHELTHWTGADDRLDRQFGKRFGDEAYAVEELVAELGAAFLGARLGVEGEHHRHASYLESWLTVLKRDSRAIVTAASAARKAAEFVLEMGAEQVQAA